MFTFTQQILMCKLDLLKFYIKKRYIIKFNFNAYLKLGFLLYLDLSKVVWIAKYIESCLRFKIP